MIKTGCIQTMPIYTEHASKVNATEHASEARQCHNPKASAAIVHDVMPCMEIMGLQGKPCSSNWNPPKPFRYRAFWWRQSQPAVKMNMCLC